MRILFAAAEMIPYVKTGGLADVAGTLPLFLAELGHEVLAAVPLYAAADTSAMKLQVGAVQMPISLGRDTVPVDILLHERAPGVTTALIHAPGMFYRSGLYGYPDDARRFILFQKAVLELPRLLRWRPDVLHIHDWQTGLLPAYLSTSHRRHPDWADTGTLFTVHNLAYQGIFPKTIMADTGLDWSVFTLDKLEFYDQVNMLKSGIAFSDVINAVSETYAAEIQTPAYGVQLDGLLRRRRDRLFGVLNGIEYDEWSPRCDPHLAEPYSFRRIEGKAENKRRLQEEIGLPVADVPLIGCVTRLTMQKGIDLIGECVDSMVAAGAQLVLLGAGDPYYEKLMRTLGARHPEATRFILGRFDNGLAHRIYAGSDLFLMPSQYEPCGLGQMIAMAYGSLPVVREVGGLADTVVDASADPKRGCGFVFAEPTPAALGSAVSRALDLYRDRDAWQRLVRRAMRRRFTWDQSAQRYVELYELACAYRRGETPAA